MQNDRRLFLAAAAVLILFTIYFFAVNNNGKGQKNEGNDIDVKTSVQRGREDDVVVKEVSGKPCSPKIELIEVIKETTKIKNVPKICPTSTEQIVPGSEGVMVPIYTTDKLINPIEPDKKFEHDEVFYNFCRFAGLMERDFLVDFLGVRTYWEWDCTIMNLPYGDYYKWVPSRRIPCDEYLPRRKQWEATREKRRFELGYLPVVDDEYPRYVNILEAVMRTKDNFVVVELGARYGTWGARALAAWKQNNPTKKATYIGVEENVEIYKQMERHMMNNGMDGDSRLFLKHAGPHSENPQWMGLEQIFEEGDIDHIDILDIDVYTAERGLLLEPGAAALLDEKVVAVHVSTHGGDIHEQISKSLELRNWIKRFDYYGNFYHCDGKVVNALQFDKSCNKETPWGSVYVRDGLLTFLNPKFVTKAP